MIKPRLRLVDTETIATWCDVAPGTIRRWASQDHWHPYGTRRHRLWNLAEATTSWRKRRATTTQLDNPVTSSEHDQP